MTGGKGMKRLSIKEWPKEERPREKILRDGPENLSDAELLAIILRTGDRTAGQTALDQARLLLSLHSGFRNLGRATSAELLAVKGIGPAKAACILATVEIARRFSSERNAMGESIHCSEDVFRHYHEKLRDKKKEVFYALLLDGKNRNIKEIKVSEGSLTASLVHPREVFNPVIRESAAGVILIHNHPSGDPTPSREDIDLTERLQEVGRLVGVKVIDHVIIGNGTYHSFVDGGRMS